MGPLLNPVNWRGEVSFMNSESDVIQGTTIVCKKDGVRQEKIYTSFGCGNFSTVTCWFPLERKENSPLVINWCRGFSMHRLLRTCLSFGILFPSARPPYICVKNTIRSNWATAEGTPLAGTVASTTVPSAAAPDHAQPRPATTSTLECLVLKRTYLHNWSTQYIQIQNCNIIWNACFCD